MSALPGRRPALPIDPAMHGRGFLPAPDPATGFPPDSAYGMLDELGRELPQRLTDDDFRARARRLRIPPWRSDLPRPYLRLYYVRLGFLASGYVNQVGQPPCHELPANLAVPLHAVGRALRRPPILSYDGYALYNWYRLDRSGPIALGNIDTLQNFVDLYDEHWFILVHVEIEAIAAGILRVLATLPDALARRDGDAVERALDTIGDCLRRQRTTLERIPEHMDPALYYRTFRPYIRFFDNVRYAGTELPPQNQRGETGAQSSIMPLTVALMKIPHRPSPLVDHLRDMRRYMPAGHRRLIAAVEALPDLRPLASAATFNRVLDAIADFREVHIGWAREYIAERTDDDRGTGGTPYMQWLQQLIDETRAHRR